jgi:hypothetical protein
VKHFKFIILVVACLFSLRSYAKEYANSYLAFDLPERWSCIAEGTEFVCRSSVVQSGREALIIFTAKEVGPSDTLDQYGAHLKQTRTIPDSRGKPSQSSVRTVSRKQIAGIPWVDGLQLGSEIPNYYTRYLATTKDRLAILVTFSAHVSVYSRYASDFMKSIQSLRVVATPDLFRPKVTAEGDGDGGGALGAGPNGMQGPGPGDVLPEPSTASKRKEHLFIFGLLLAAIGGYIFLKMRKK